MKGRAEIAVTLLGLLLLVLGAFVSVRQGTQGMGYTRPGPGPVAEEHDRVVGSVADTGPRGTAALYLLLKRLGHRVERRTNVRAAIPDERVRIVVGHAFPPDPGVLAWVARGNTLIQAPPPPGEAAGERTQGAGRLVFLPSADALTNASLADRPDPAVKVAALCGAHAYGGAVVFDESPRWDPALTASLMRFPAWVAAIFGALAFALLVGARAPRFGPPLPRKETVAAPLVVEQVRALADLYEQRGAYSLAGQTLRAHFRRRALRALGMTEQADDATLAAAFVERFGGKGAELVTLLAQAGARNLSASGLARVARGLYGYERKMERIS